MRRNHRIIAAVAVALVALAVPVALVARALPPRTVSELVATPSTYFPVVPVLFNAKYPVAAVPLEEAKDGSQRLEVHTPRLPKVTGAQLRLEVAVATYLRTPTRAIHFTLLGPGGERIGSCSIPPTGYHDNTTVQCPVAHPDRLRRVVMSANGGPPLALYASKIGKRLVAGALVRQRHLGGLGARLGELRRWLGVVRPPLFSPIVLFVLLTLSTALLGAAWLVAAGAETQRE